MFINKEDNKDINQEPIGTVLSTEDNNTYTALGQEITMQLNYPDDTKSADIYHNCMVINKENNKDINQEAIGIQCYLLKITQLICNSFSIDHTLIPSCQDVQLL